MSRGDYFAGAVLLLAVLAGCGGAAWLIVDRRLGWMPARVRWIAWALLATAALMLAHLVPLALGVLTRGTAVGASLLVLLAATRVRRVAAGPAETRAGGRSDLWEWLPALAAAVVAAAYVIAFLRVNRAVAISDIDSTGFHLPVVARWIQTGSLWRFDDFVAGWGFGAYPQTGNLVQLAVVLPWHDDFLVRAVGPLFLLLCAGAAYALAAELGARRAPATAFATLAVMVPATVAAGVDHGQTDAIMAAGFGCGALFLVRHARTGRLAELALAAVGLGIAFGTKWYGPPEVLAVLVVWLVARLIARQGLRRPALDALATGGLTLLAGGIWLVRNLVVSGDPIFPKPVRLLGATVFPGTVAASDRIGHSVLSVITDSHVLRAEIWPQYKLAFSLAGGLLAAGALLGVAVAARRRDGRALAVAAGALVLLLVYLALPETAEGPKGGPVLVTAAVRYTGPAMLLAATAAAWAVSRLGRWAIVGELAVLAGLAHAISRDRRWSAHFGAVTAAHVAEAAVALVLVAALARVVAGRRPALPVLAVGAGLLVIGAGLAGRKVQNEFDAARYRDAGPPLAWFAKHPLPGLRVALAGSTGRDPFSSPYPAFGPRLRNHVDFVGARRRHLLVRYPRAAFLSHLALGRYGVLVVGRLRDGTTPEVAWARAAGWRVLATDPTYTLLAAPGSAAASSRAVASHE